MIKLQEKVLAIDIGGTSIKTGIVEGDKIIEFASYKNVWKGAQEKLTPFFSKIFSHWIEKYNITKIGIGCPGDIIDNVVVSAANLKWHDFHLLDELQAIYPQMTIKIENDGRAATLAELTYGKLKDVKNGIFIVFGRGVGGSLVINHEIYTGSFTRGGNFGHMVIKNYKARKCNCGRRGCFETYASVAGLVQTIKDINYHSKNPVPLKELGGLRVMDLANNQHPIVIKAIKQWNLDIAESILSLALILDPSHIILAGGITESGLIDIEVIKEKLREQHYDNVVVELSDFKSKAGLVGAATLLK